MMTPRQSKKQLAEKPENGLLQTSQLMKLFKAELKDIYWAEKALTKVIPKMIKNATCQGLNDALTSHLAETTNQVTRLEKVFEYIGKDASSKKCDAMNGLIKEAKSKIKSYKKGAMRDAGIIAAVQKAEHFEIASYGTLRQFAKTLGVTEAVKLLEETLKEEKAADAKLSEVAQSINVEAAEVKIVSGVSSSSNG